MGPARRAIVSVCLLVGTVLAGCIQDAAPPAATDDTGNEPQWIPEKVRILGNVSNASTGLVAQAFPEGIVPRTEWVDTGFAGAEPNIGITSSGNVFVSAYQRMIRSVDAGANWDVVETHPQTLDPMMWVDPITDRIFFDSLYVGCSFRSYSDDDGDSWTFLPAACGIPGIDHQKIATAPLGSPAPPTAGQLYPNAFYYCYNKIASTACAVSFDGGITSAYETQVAVREPVGSAVDLPCGGQNTNPIGASDGTVYVGMGWVCPYAAVGVTTDNGLTWDVKTIDGVNGGTELDPDMAVTPDGTAYYMNRDNDFLPYIVRSSDRFDTASEPFYVAPPEVTATRFTVMTAGDDGRIAFGFLGSENFQGDPDAADDDATWHAYMGYSLDADTDDPTFVVVRLTDDDDPVQRGSIHEGGGADPDRNLLDFIDLHTGPEGRAYMVFADGCISEACRSENGTPEDSRADQAVVGLFVEGPSLFVANGPLTVPPAFMDEAVEAAVEGEDGEDT